MRIKEKVLLLFESVNDPSEVHASLQLEALRHPFARKLIQGHLSRLSENAGSKLLGVVFSL